MTAARLLPRSPNSLQQIEFVGRIGVGDTRVDGVQIKGRWANQLEVLRGERARALPEEFANWPGDLDKPRDVLRFTRRYAPLQVAPSPGAEFKFDLSQWVNLRDSFRLYWENFGAKAAPEHWRHSPRTLPPAAQEIRKVHDANPSSHSDKLREYFARLEASWPGLDLEKAYPLWLNSPEEGEFLSRSRSQLIYGAGTLWRFLTLTLFSTAGERLRKCHNPECKAPHFVARHLNQNYCSEPCARWGQRQHTLAWWNEHGKQQRQKRLKNRRARRTRVEKEKTQ